MKVLIINGHPRRDSLSALFTKAYAEGAGEANAYVEVLNLAELHFDMHVTTRHPHDQFDEPDIIKARQLIEWSEHVVFIYPTWWGTMPALLKGFIDRVFVSGFAFSETEGGTGYAPLLRGRTAELITTMDTPKIVYRLIYRSPGHNAMRRAVLTFSGFTVTKVTSFGIVKKAEPSEIQNWVAKVKNRGLRLRRGSVSKWQQLSLSVSTWIKAIRLQFYPMTFIAYSAGALAAERAGYGFDALLFWVGYAWLFFLEVTTVLSNDYFDFDSDRRNERYGPFTGGSRVLVTGQLSFRQMSKGILFTLSISLALLSWLFISAPAGMYAMIFTCGSLMVLALGYTVPPLKLCHRGLGELTVGLTHSFAVILSGYIFQGGILSDRMPWAISLPLFLAVLPSITLSGIPDHEADKAASKQTLAVKLGKKGAAYAALVFTSISALVILLFELLHILPGTFHGILFGVLPHAVLLGWMLLSYIKNENPPARIDGLMIAALTYLMWFAVVPLINLK